MEFQYKLDEKSMGTNIDINKLGSDSRRRLAAAYSIILNTAMQEREPQEKQIPESDEFADLTDSGEDTQTKEPEHE